MTERIIIVGSDDVAEIVVRLAKSFESLGIEITHVTRKMAEAFKLLDIGDGSSLTAEQAEDLLKLAAYMKDAGDRETPDYQYGFVAIVNAWVAACPGHLDRWPFPSGFV